MDTDMTLTWCHKMMGNSDAEKAGKMHKKILAEFVKCRMMDGRSYGHLSHFTPLEPTWHVRATSEHRKSTGATLSVYE